MGLLLNFEGESYDCCVWDWNPRETKKKKKDEEELEKRRKMKLKIEIEAKREQLERLKAKKDMLLTEIDEFKKTSIEFMKNKYNINGTFKGANFLKEVILDGKNTDKLDNKQINDIHILIKELKNERNAALTV